MKLESLAAAALVAGYNLTTSAPVVALMAATASLAGVSDSIGPRGVAVVFATIAALWRWFYFVLSPREGAAGLLITAVAGFILGDSTVPIVGPILREMNAESLPMWNGFLVGLFGVLLFGLGQDFLRAYAAKKAGGVK